MGALLWPGLSHARLWGQAYSDQMSWEKTVDFSVTLKRVQTDFTRPSTPPPHTHTQIRTWYQELCVCGGSWWTGRIGLHSLQGYRKSSASLYPRIGSPSFSYIIIVSIRLTGWLSLSRMFSSLGFQALPPSTCLCSSLTAALPDPFLSLTVSVRTQSENMQVIQTEKLWYEELFTTSVSFYILEKVAKRRSGRGL